MSLLVPFGGGQRAYVIFATSEVVAALLTTPAAVPLLERLEKCMMVFYGKYKIYSRLEVEDTDWAWILRRI